MKYLIHMGICGFGNQLLGFKEACIIAKYTNRVIVEPIFIPHGTIRDLCKNTYHKFSDIFDSNHFRSHIMSVDFQHIHNIKIRNVYNIRHGSEDKITDPYYYLQKDYYNISTDNSKRLNTRYITNLDELKELNNIKDDVLVILGTLNTIKLSTCCMNGCMNDNCGYNKIFLDDYNDISKAIIFNNNVNKLTNKVLRHLKLRPKEFCAFHLRIQDKCENTLFKNNYNEYDESVLYQSIVNYLYENKNHNLVDKMFVSLPPQALKIKDMEIFNSDKVCVLDHNNYKYDAFILSIVELNICEKSKILIHSPTNRPYIEREHTQSSFVLHTMDIRRLNNANKKDICVSKIYNKINIENIKLINKTNKKIIATSLNGNKDSHNNSLLLNDILNKSLLPGWILRVYIDNTTNMDFISKIKDNNNIEIIKINTVLDTKYHRFFPIYDPNVEVFISRDSCTSLTLHEKSMIAEWLKNNKQLYLIYDDSPDDSPDHKYTTTNGIFGFKKNSKINSKKSDEVETPINPIDRNKVFYYYPWRHSNNGYCNVVYKDDEIIICPHDDYNSNRKVMKIQKKDFKNFYNGKTIKCVWDNKQLFSIQKINNDIKIFHESGEFYFICQNDAASNPIDKNAKFYYQPWDAYCNVSYRGNGIIINPHNNHNSNRKVMKIQKKILMIFTMVKQLNVYGIIKT